MPYWLFLIVIICFSREIDADDIDASKLNASVKPHKRKKWDGLRDHLHLSSQKTEAGQTGSSHEEFGCKEKAQCLHSTNDTVKGMDRLQLLENQLNEFKELFRFLISKCDKKNDPKHCYAPSKAFLDCLHALKKDLSGEISCQCSISEYDEIKSKSGDTFTTSQKPLDMKKSAPDFYLIGNQTRNMLNNDMVLEDQSYPCLCKQNLAFTDGENLKLRGSTLRHDGSGGSSKKGNDENGKSSSGSNTGSAPTSGGSEPGRNSDDDDDEDDPERRGNFNLPRPHYNENVAPIYDEYQNERQHDEDDADEIQLDVSDANGNVNLADSVSRVLPPQSSVKQRNSHNTNNSRAQGTRTFDQQGMRKNENHQPNSGNGGMATDLNGNLPCGNNSEHDTQLDTAGSQTVDRDPLTNHEGVQTPPIPDQSVPEPQTEERCGPENSPTDNENTCSGQDIVNSPSMRGEEDPPSHPQLQQSLDVNIPRKRTGSVTESTSIRPRNSNNAHSSYNHESMQTLQRRGEEPGPSAKRRRFHGENDIPSRSNQLYRGEVPGRGPDSNVAGQSSRVQRSTDSANREIESRCDTARTFYHSPLRVRISCPTCQDNLITFQYMTRECGDCGRRFCGVDCQHRHDCRRRTFCDDLDNGGMQHNQHDNMRRCSTCHHQRPTTSGEGLVNTGGFICYECMRNPLYHPQPHDAPRAFHDPPRQDSVINDVISMLCILFLLMNTGCHQRASD